MAEEKNKGEHADIARVLYNSLRANLETKGVLVLGCHVHMGLNSIAAYLHACVNQT